MARIVVVGDQDHVGSAQEFAVLLPPLPRSAAAARCGQAPRPHQIGFTLAFNDDDRSVGGDRFDKLSQAIRNDWHTVDVPNSLARLIGVRTLLSERLFPLAVLYNEGPICILMLDALDDEGDRAI